MESASVYKSLKLRWRDGAWLFVAFMLHGSLLLIPFKQIPPEQEQLKVLSLSLLAPLAPKPATEKTPDPVLPPEITKPEAEEVQKEATPFAELPQTEPPEIIPEEPSDPATTARLVESASRLKWSFPKTAEHRQLGVHRDQEIPENWRPSIRLDDNLFDGMTVPRQASVVDEWVASDGTHNVVINTPTGETLCGRRQASDPLRPMIEHLMMFRSCGGGGKRTFKMPDRFSKHLVD